MTITRYRAHLTGEAIAVLEERMTLAEEAAAAAKAAEAGMGLFAYLASRILIHDRLEAGVELVEVGFVDLDHEIALAEAAAEVVGSGP